MKGSTTKYRARPLNPYDLFEAATALSGRIWTQSFFSSESLNYPLSMVQELYELSNLTAMQSTLEVLKHLMKNHESLPRGMKLEKD